MSIPLVPLLGFDDEWHDGNTNLLNIKVPGYKMPIQVYRWNGPVEGYNVFWPGDFYTDLEDADFAGAISVKTPFEAKMIIQDFINQKAR